MKEHVQSVSANQRTKSRAMAKKKEEESQVLSCTEVNIQKREELSSTQINLLGAMEASMGVVSTACEALGISRTNHYKWMKDSPAYKENYESITNKALDFAESKLYEMIGKGNTACVIFYLKTKGKERGYIERQELKVEQTDPDLSGYSTDQLLDLISQTNTEDQ